MIKKAADMELIAGFKPSENAFSITHLHFADDLIVFLDDNVEQIQNLKNILLAFELISGLKVNFKKSVVAAVGNALHTTECALLFGCPLTSFPMKYLGIPLGHKSKAVGIWDVILHKFQKKLSIWQRRYLSKGGRLMLIIHVLSSLPVYYLSLFQLPVSVEKQIKIMKQFLWVLQKQGEEGLGVLGQAFLF